jgi:hypothetical protein
MMFAKIFMTAVFLAIISLQDARAQLSDQNGDDYKRFVARELCVLTAYLNALGGSDIDRNQYVIISPENDDSKYVQCLFRLDEPILCEASSYYYRNNRKGPKLYRLSDAKRALLESYNFTFRPRGNFYIQIERPADHDYEPLARFMLTVLYEAYDVRFFDVLRVQRPKTINAVRVWRACDNPHVQQN